MNNQNVTKTVLITVQVATLLNYMQATDYLPKASAERAVEISEQVLAPIWSTVEVDDKEILKMVQDNLLKS